MKTILAIDPSGNFKEGKGTTGWVLLREDYHVLDRGYVSADDYNSAEAYWDDVTNLIEQFSGYDTYVVVEGYKLYNHHGMKAEVQSNSELETPQLIGVIRQFCYKWQIRLTIQFAPEVKTRWGDIILAKLGLLTKKGQRYYMGLNQLPCNRHERDALRHAVHLNRYKLNNKLEKDGE